MRILVCCVSLCERARTRVRGRADGREERPDRKRTPTRGVGRWSGSREKKIQKIEAGVLCAEAGKNERDEEGEGSEARGGRTREEEKGGG